MAPTGTEHESVHSIVLYLCGGDTANARTIPAADHRADCHLLGADDDAEQDALAVTRKMVASQYRYDIDKKIVRLQCGHQFGAHCTRLLMHNCEVNYKSIQLFFALISCANANSDTFRSAQVCPPSPSPHIHQRVSISHRVVPLTAICPALFLFALFHSISPSDTRPSIVAATSRLVASLSGFGAVTCTFCSASTRRRWSASRAASWSAWSAS